MIDAKGNTLLYEFRHLSKYSRGMNRFLTTTRFRSISQFKKFLKDHPLKYFSKEDYRAELKKMKEFFGTTVKDV